MFRGREDAGAIRRLADNSDSDEEARVPSKWEEPVTTNVTPTSQHDSITTNQEPNGIKTGSKRALACQVS